MTDNADPEGCYGCFDRNGRRNRHDSYFVDTRTGRRFCAECVVALATWELDGSPNNSDATYPFPYPKWIEEPTPKPPTS